MSEDLDFIFSAGSRRAPVGGRRARDTTEAENDDAPSQPNVQPTESPQDFPIPNRPGRRKNMWEDNDAEEEVIDSRLVVGNVQDDASDDDDIPVIPDLEQLQDEPLIEQIAAPPTTLLNEMLSYQELDTDLMKQSAFQLLDNEIDMKLLTKALVPERETQDHDETWEMDKLFTEVRSLITSVEGQAKSGRRAKQAQSNTSVTSDSRESSVPETMPQPSDIGQESPPRPARKMGGWGEVATPSRRARGVEDSRLLMTEEPPKTRISSDDEDEIQAIPDLDEVQDDDLTQQMAAPPSVAMNQMATYRELDTDLQMHSTFTLLDNEIDMKLLAKHMADEKEVKEQDEAWEWDRIFTQVSSNLKSMSKVKTETQSNLM